MTFSETAGKNKQEFMNGGIRYSDFSTEEKAEFLKIAEKIVKLRITAEHEGLFALEVPVAEIVDCGFFRKNEKFLQKACYLVIDGTESNQVRSIMEIYIENSAETPFELLAFKMILEGVLLIQAAKSLSVMIEKMAVFAGILESEAIVEKLRSKADEISQKYSESSGKRDIRSFVSSEIWENMSQEKIERILSKHGFVPSTISKEEIAAILAEVK